MKWKKKIDVDGSPTSCEANFKIITLDKNICIFVAPTRLNESPYTQRVYDAGLFEGKGPEAIEGDLVFWTRPITRCEASFESRVTTQIMWVLSLSKKERRLGNRMCDMRSKGPNSRVTMRWNNINENLAKKFMTRSWNNGRLCSAKLWLVFQSKRVYYKPTTVTFTMLGLGLVS